MKTGQRNVVSMLICRNSYLIFYKAIKTALNLVCQARFCFTAQFITWRGKMNMIDLQIQRDGFISFQKMYGNLWEIFNFYMFKHIFCFKSSKIRPKPALWKKAEICKVHFEPVFRGLHISDGHHWKGEILESIIWLQKAEKHALWVDFSLKECEKCSVPKRNFLLQSKIKVFVVGN